MKRTATRLVLGLAFALTTATTPVVAQQAPLLSFASYLGGSSYDAINGVARDADGNLIVVGSTASSDFPTVEPSQPALAGSFDAFVAGIDPVNGLLLFSTYDGGTATDFFEDVAVDGEGNVFVVGSTDSADFPDAPPEGGQGGSDVVVVKLTPAGQRVFSVRLGAEGRDEGHGIALADFDGDGGVDVYVTGTTRSAGLATVDPVQAALGGGTDAFVYVLDGATGVVRFGTYLGGTGDETGNAIAVGHVDGDERADVFVTGGTDSDDFATRGRTVTRRIDPYLVSLLTGGAAKDGPFTLHVDLGAIDETDPDVLDGDDEAWDVSWLGSANPGNVAVVGETTSSAFPTTEGALQQGPYPNDKSDAFFVVIDTDTGDLVYSTLAGGPGDEAFRSVDVDGDVIDVNGESGSFVVLNGLPQQGNGRLIQLNLSSTFSFLRLVRAGTTPNILVQKANGPCTGGSSQFGQEINDAAVTLQPTEAGGGDGLLACFAALGMATLGITKTANKNVSEVGDAVEYTIDITNTSGTDATEVRGGDYFDDEALEIVTSSILGFRGISNDGGAALFTEPFDLPAGETVSWKVRARVKKATDFLENRANVIASNAMDAPTAQASIAADPSDGSLQIVAPSASGGKGGVEAVDIYLDGIRLANDVPLTAAFLPATFTRTSPIVDVVAASDTDNSAPLASFVVDLLYPHPDSIIAFSRSTVLIVDGIDRPPGRAISKHAARLTALAPASIDVFVAHIGAGVGAIDVRLVDDTPAHHAVATLAEGLPEDTVTTYVTIDPGLYDVEVDAAGGASLGLYRFDLANRDGDALALVVSNGVEGVTVVAVAADGTIIRPTAVTAAQPSDDVPGMSNSLTGYPNPFTSRTHLVYRIVDAEDVRLDVYDLLGRRIRTLVEERMPPGTYDVSWDGAAGDGSHVAAGVYVLRLSAGKTWLTRSVVLLR